MSGKWGHPANMPVIPMGTFVSIALLFMAISTPALSQVYDDAAGTDLTTRLEDHERFEVERRRQQQLQFEAERREQEKMRFETERLRQENERREQERLRLENERLQQEIERQEQEQLRLEEEKERARAQTVAARTQTKEPDQNTHPDIYEQLRTIGQLRDDGILTEEEFQNLKKKILD